MKKLWRVAVWFWFCLEFAMAELIQVPSNTEAKVNDSTYLNCSTSLLNGEIIWKHGSAYVYAGGAVIHPYSSRFQVEKNSSNGSYNLVILSVRPKDYGEYACQDDSSHGMQHVVQLTVLEGDPICDSDVVGDGVVGQNDCGIEPEELTLSCTVTYYGETPILEWIKDGESNPVNTGTKSEVSGNNMTHSLRMKGDLNLTNSVYFCQTTRSAGKQYSCHSDHIKVQYVFTNNVTVNKTLNEEVTCSANSSHSCSYKWYLGSKLVTHDRILNPKESGMYLCEAECLLRNKSCTVVALVVNVTSKNAVVSSNLTIIVASVVIIIILAICVAAIVIILICRRREKSRAKMTDASASDKFDLKQNSTQETKDVSETEFLLQQDFQLKAETEQNKEQLSTEKQSAQEQSPVIEKAKQTTAEQSNGIEEFSGKEQSTKKEKQITGKENVNEQPTSVKQGSEIERLTEKEPAIEKKQVDKVDVSSMSGPDAHREQDHEKKDPVLFKEMTTDTKSGRITGIATSEETLYVAFENSSFLETFDLIEFNRKETRNIEGLINPQDIVFCSKNQYLYVSDHKTDTMENEMFKCDLLGNITGKWLTGEYFGKLSVANDGNVILSVHYKNTLFEYTEYGQLVCQIKLSYSTRPHHAIKLKDDQYLIIYESKRKTIITSRVCLVNEGAVAQFDKEKLNATEALTDPKYLALGHDGSVLVLDGNRVLWITCALEYKQKFLPQLQFPVRMILHKSKGYLIFANNQGLLQVYKLT